MSTSIQLRTSAFKQVDVFTSEPLQGNPLAVVLDAEDLSSADMQRIAAWTNLSETTFVLAPTQPGASYRLRIFTPRRELPFAGHPSIGTLHALLEAGHLDPAEHMLQECAAGLLPMRVDGHGAQRRIFVRAPRAKMLDTDVAVAASAEAALGAKVVASRLLDNGPHWLICDLQQEATVRALDPDMAAIAALSLRISAVGVAVFGRSTGSAYALAVRAFCPADGIPEDPVTGSANAAIGAYLYSAGELGAAGANFRVSQGREVGRNGSVDVCVDMLSGDVEIGGQSVTCVDGTLILPNR